MNAEENSSVNAPELAIEERKEKILSFLKKNKQGIYYLILAFIVWIGGIFIRTANISRLKDVTTGSWTLAPDLDPFYFLRLAKEIVANGGLAAIDTMRNVPLGFNNAGELTLPSYMIAYLYKFLHIFSPTVTVDYAAIIYPAIFFCLTLVAFFLFVRKVFSDYKHSDIIALGATAFFAVIPGFVHRTVAGVPEKEAAAFFFMFMALYWIVAAWKSSSMRSAIILGLLAGISTGVMGMIWGGVTFILVVIALTVFLAFFFSKVDIKETAAYLSWIVGFTFLLLEFSKFGMGLFTSTTSGLAYFVALLLITDFILHKKLKHLLKLERINLPDKLVSLIALLALVFVGVLIFQPSMLTHIYNDLYENLVRPFAGNRFTVTVAENNRPFFDSWLASFGKWFFWIFVAGASLLVYEIFKKFNKQDRITVTALYFLMTVGMVFSRYSSSTKMNGDTPISLFFFIGSILLFFGSLFYYYLKRNEFELDWGLLLLSMCFFFAVFSARSSIRLFYFIYPIAPILAAFIAVRLTEMAFEKKEGREELIEYTLKALAIVVLIILIFPPLYKTGIPLKFEGAWFSYEQTSLAEAKYGSVPGHYQEQWQRAMAWVRNETAPGAVFAHWWDYGYWVQTIGERPTIVDGGNAIVYWNHLTGRHALTAENETEALEFLNMHNTSYFLIDSSDIGKYPAFSSIGGDENYDRYIWVSTFYLNEKATQEKRNETVYRYEGGTRLDRDFIWNGQLYPAEQAGIAAVFLPMQNGQTNITRNVFGQPTAVLVYQNKQVTAPVKCLYFEGEKIEFEGEGYDGCLYLIPVINGGQMNRFGAALWLSEKLMDSLMIKMYLFNESTNFEVSHVENNPIVDALNSQFNLGIKGFVIYGNAGFIGPLTIWKINYPAGLTERPEYLEKDYPKKELSEVRR